MNKRKPIVFGLVVALGLLLFVANVYAANGNSKKGIAERVADIEDLFSHFQQSLISFGGSITALQNADKEQEERISSLSNTVAQLQKDLSSVQNSDSSQHERILSLEQLVANQQNTISGLTSEISSLQQQLQQLQLKVEYLENNALPPAQESHSISGIMVDSNDHPFFSGFGIINEHGIHYSLSSRNTDSGQFTFSDIPDGTYSIRFYFSTYVVDSPQVITVSGGDINGLVVKLAVPTYTISGKLVDPSGAPIPTQSISLQDRHNLGGYWSPTSNDGSFTLGGIAPGSYTLVFGDPNSPLATVDIVVTDNHIQDVRVTSKTDWESVQTTVTGSVYGADGTPLQGVNLRLHDNGGYYGASTDSAGKFTINVREAGTYQLLTAEQGYFFAAQSQIDVESGIPAQVTLQLIPGGTIQGQIDFQHITTPQYVSVKVLSEDESLINRIYAQTNGSNGSYSLNAPPGTYTLLVESDQGSPIYQTIIVSPEQTIIQNFTL